MTTAVIFDIDGTLLDSVDFHAKAWHEAFAAFGYETDFQTLRREVGKGGDTLLPVFLSKEDIEKYGEKIEEKRGEIFKGKYLRKIKPFPMVRELFQKILSGGGKIALASSAKKDEVEEYKKIAGIADLIEAETSADDAEQSKPHPDIFAAALKKLGDIPAETVVVVGDTIWDAKAAGKLKIRPVGVSCGGFPAEELIGAGCIAVYQNPADLLANYEDSPLARR